MDLETQPANPYSPPAATLPAPPDASASRARLLRKEAILRLLGILYITLSLGMAAAFGFMTQGAWSFEAPFLLLVGSLLILASSFFFGGYRLVRLRPGRRYAIVLTGIFLLWVLAQMVTPLENISTEPKAAIQSCAFLAILTSGLWVLLSRDGRFMLSPEYRPIVAATPQLQVWRTPAMLVGLLVILVVIFTSVQRIERIEPSALPEPADSAESFPSE